MPPLSAKSILWYWGPAILMLVLIGIESSDLMSSAHTSGVLLPLLRAIFRNLPLERLEEFHAVIRKAGHVVGYGLLSWFLFRAWWGTARPEAEQPMRSWQPRFAVFGFAGAALVAIADELHQMTIPSRGGSWWDVALDSFAALIAQWLIARLYRRVRLQTKTPVEVR